MTSKIEFGQENNRRMAVQIIIKFNTPEENCTGTNLTSFYGIIEVTMFI